MNDQKAILAALDFQRAAGVTATVGTQPVDRFADSRAPEPQLKVQPVSVAKPAPPPPLTHFEPGAPLLGGEMAGLPHAQAAAQAAQSIPDLVKAIEAFEYCELKKTARSTVVFDGNPAAQVMLVGEAPGAQEDAEGNQEPTKKRAKKNTIASNGTSSTILLPAPSTRAEAKRRPIR